MMPEMTGGVFWEHLHRLVAGGLLLLWGLATWLARKEAAECPWVFRGALAGVGLLLVQSVFGGLTVLFRLPDLVSTTHLALALAFLALATVLASSTAAGPRESGGFDARGLGAWATACAALVFAQSVLGALVRHMDAGMACPDVPLCLGTVVPPLVNAPIAAHFFHRVLAVVATIAVLLLWSRVHRSEAPLRMRRWALTATALVLVQVGLGAASVLTVLAVLPVSLHTLVAAGLLAVLVHMATSMSPAPTPAPPRVHADVA
jgi:cytochrome c oxidase assembly protein subunit 15